MLLLTQALGPAGFGILTFGLAIQFYIVMLGSSGPGLVIVRDWAVNPAESDSVLAAYCFLTGLFSSIGCLVLVLGSGLVPTLAGERAFFVWIGVGSIAASMSLFPFFDIFHRQARSASVNVVAELATLAGIVYLTRTQKPTVAEVGGLYAAKWILTLTGQLLIYHLTIRPVRCRYSPGRCLSLLRSSLSMTLTGIVLLIPLTSGILFVRSVQGDSAAGIYGLAYQVAYAYYGIGALAIRVVQPHIMGPYGLTASFLVKLVFFMLMLIALLVCIVFLTTCGVICGILEKSYQGAIVPLVFLLATASIMLCDAIAQLYLFRLGEARFLCIVHVGKAVAYVLGCFLVVGPLSSEGVAGISVISVGIGTVFDVGRCWWKGREHIRTVTPVRVLQG